VCRPPDRFETALTDLTWKEWDDEVMGTYSVHARNLADRQVCVFSHDVSANSRNSADYVPPNAWGAGCSWIAEAGEIQGQDANVLREGWNLWKETNGDAGSCYYAYRDRIVAVYYDCADSIMKQLKGTTPEQRAAILDPLAASVPVDDRAKSFSCP
jgi:hypothetical protein